MKKKGGALCALAIAALVCAGCGESKSALNPKEPVTVTIWNYYNGAQLTAFEQALAEFNSTVGLERGVVAVSVSQSDIGTLVTQLTDAVEEKAGAAEIPTLAAVYSETAFVLEEAGALAPLDPYFTEEELTAYIPAFIEEGRFTDDGQLWLFPVCKSTEVFAANETDWAAFAAATGVTLEDLRTQEDLVAAAETYYDWTDSLTPDVAEDGKALYGRDSIGNYIYVGCKQLGHEVLQQQDGELTIQLDRDTFKTLWDNYYIPYINGYFGAYASFRSEDAKIGRILALTGATTGVNYLPTAVTLADDTTHPIQMRLSAPLEFRDAVNHVEVQQGASYCLLRTTPAEQEGAALFLHWFTQPEQNVDFSIDSGYSPVTREANQIESLTAAYGSKTPASGGQNVLQALTVSAELFTAGEPYAAKPFTDSRDLRRLLENSLDETCRTDREAVLAAMAGGASRADAVAPYTDDAYFDAWFAELCAQAALMKR